MAAASQASSATKRGRTPLTDSASTSSSDLSDASGGTGDLPDKGPALKRRCLPQEPLGTAAKALAAQAITLENIVRDLSIASDKTSKTDKATAAFSKHVAERLRRMHASPFVLNYETFVQQFCTAPPDSWKCASCSGLLRWTNRDASLSVACHLCTANGRKRHQAEGCGICGCGVRFCAQCVHASTELSGERAFVHQKDQLQCVVCAALGKNVASASASDSGSDSGSDSTPVIEGDDVSQAMQKVLQLERARMAFEESGASAALDEVSPTNAAPAEERMTSAKLTPEGAVCVMEPHIDDGPSSSVTILRQRACFKRELEFPLPIVRASLVPLARENDQSLVIAYAANNSGVYIWVPNVDGRYTSTGLQKIMPAYLPSVVIAPAHSAHPQEMPFLWVDDAKGNTRVWRYTLFGTWAQKDLRGHTEKVTGVVVMSGAVRLSGQSSHPVFASCSLDQTARLHVPDLINGIMRSVELCKLDAPIQGMTAEENPDGTCTLAMWTENVGCFHLTRLTNDRNAETALHREVCVVTAGADGALLDA